MKTLITLATVTLMGLSGAALAAGDADKGAKDFKKCKSCHMLANGDDVIVKGGKTGPNLFGIIGRQAGTYEGFKYGPSMVAARESGLVWTEKLLTDFIADPKAFMKDFTGDSSAKSKMTFKLKNGENVAAYLASLGS